MKNIIVLLIMVGGVLLSSAILSSCASKNKIVETSEDEKIYMVPEKMPTFSKGSPATWIASKVRYPIEAQKSKIQGKVFVKFVVERDGSISNVEILKSSHKLLSEEAIRVVKSMPKWNPGENEGKFVRVRYNIPINFKLAQSMNKNR